MATAATAGKTPKSSTRTLKPGQRHPTPGDINDAFWADRAHRSTFPQSPEWEITPENCRSWSRHNFGARRGDTSHFRRMADLSDDEFALFLWDLNAWFDLQSKWWHAHHLRQLHARFTAEADAGTHTRPNWIPPELPAWRPCTLQDHLLGRIGEEGNRHHWGWLGPLIYEFLELQGGG